MADELEILTINAAGNSWVDLIPGGVATGYQIQNTNIEAHRNGYDNTSLVWNSGTSKLDLEISGVVDINGLPFVVKSVVSLSIASAGIWYVKIVAGSDFEHMSASLVSTAGTFDASKMAFYQAGDRVLDWKIFYDGTTAPVIIKRQKFGFIPAMEKLSYPFANIDNILKDDLQDSIPLPAGLTYWSFGSPKICNSAGVAPTIRHNVEFKAAGTTEAKFAGRGTTYHNLGFSLWSHTFGNEMTIALRIYPKFAYNVSQNTFILDSRGLSGSSDDSFILYYDQATDKLTFIVRDDSTHLLTITTDAYVNNAALQIPHDIYIRWSKANNDGDMYINNVRQGAGVAGTKTMTNNISALNITKTSFVIGASAFAAGWYANYDTTLFYIQDLIISSTYATTWLDNYDGGTVYPYWITSWLSGEKHDWQIDTNGVAGFNHVAAEKGIFGSVDIGAGQFKMKKIAIGAWNMNITGGGSGAASVTIAHGITGSKIAFKNAIVFDDGGNTHFIDTFMNSADPALMYGGYGTTGVGTGIDTSISLRIRTGGLFDSASFNDASMNRGYIWLIYEV